MVDTVFAGFVLLNPIHGTVTAVRGTYTQPRATCFSGENGSQQYANGQNAFVGPGLYDGDLGLSNFAIYQMGTEAVCQPFHLSPSYLPFYYRLALRPSDPPNPDQLLHPIPGISVSPGDTIASRMVWTAGTIQLTFADKTTGRSVSLAVPASGFRPNGAFCMVNVFGTIARFSSFSQSCLPTVHGKTAGIGSFASTNTVFGADMVNATGTVQVSESGLSAGGSTFVTTWHTSRPLAQVFAPGQTSLFPGSHLAGYLLLPRSRAPVESVSESYVVPRASCYAGETVENATGHYPNDQTAMVGPGLLAGSTDFANFRFFQVGTESWCQIFFAKAVYLPFFLTEVVTPADPAGDFAVGTFPGITISPGDAMHATVTVTGEDAERDDHSGRATFTLTDRTTGVTVRATISTTPLEAIGAACVMEPFINTAHIAPLTQSCWVTLHGLTRGIGDFGRSDTLLRFDLHSPVDATVVQARTSELSEDGAKFTIDWLTSQPFGF